MKDPKQIRVSQEVMQNRSRERLEQKRGATNERGPFKGFELMLGKGEGRVDHRTLTYIVRGSITVWLTSCLNGLDLTKLVNLYLIQHKQSSWIRTRKSAVQWYFPLRSKWVFSGLEILWALPIILFLHILWPTGCKLRKFPIYEQINSQNLAIITNP